MEFKMKLSEENQGGGRRKGRKFEKTDIILMRLGWAYLQTEETMAQLSNWPRSEISFLCFHWCCGMFYSVVPELSTALSSFPLSTPKPPRRISSSCAFVSPRPIILCFRIKEYFCCRYFEPCPANKASSILPSVSMNDACSDNKSYFKWRYFIQHRSAWEMKLLEIVFLP